MTMTDNELFQASADDKPAEQAPHQVNEDHDYLSDLVGEGKKYKDPQSLAKALLHSQIHIKDLEKENADFRQAVQQGLTREEFYEALKTLQKPSPSNEPQEGREPEREEVSKEQIQALVRESVNQSMSERQQEANLAYSVTKAREALGEGFQKMLKDRARDLGESEAELTILARNKPKVFLELMIPKSPDNPQIPGIPRSQLDSGKSSSGMGSEVRNLAYYKRLKQTDPARYKSPQNEIQMHKDALALGEKFFQ